MPVYVEDVYRCPDRATNTVDKAFRTFPSTVSLGRFTLNIQRTSGLSPIFCPFGCKRYTTDSTKQMEEHLQTTHKEYHDRASGLSGPPLEEGELKKAVEAGKEWMRVMMGVGVTVGEQYMAREQHYTRVRVKPEVYEEEMGWLEDEDEEESESDGETSEETDFTQLEVTLDDLEGLVPGTREYNAALRLEAERAHVPPTSEAEGISETEAATSKIQKDEQTCEELPALADLSTSDDNRVARRLRESRANKKAECERWGFTCTEKVDAIEVAYKRAVDELRLKTRQAMMVILESSLESLDIGNVEAEMQASEYFAVCLPWSLFAVDGNCHTHLGILPMFTQNSIRFSSISHTFPLGPFDITIFRSRRDAPLHCPFNCGYFTHGNTAVVVMSEHLGGIHETHKNYYDRANGISGPPLELQELFNATHKQAAQAVAVSLGSESQVMVSTVEEYKGKIKPEDRIDGRWDAFFRSDDSASDEGESNHVSGSDDAADESGCARPELFPTAVCIDIPGIDSGYLTPDSDEIRRLNPLYNNASEAGPVGVAPTSEVDEISKPEIASPAADGHKNQPELEYDEKLTDPSLESLPKHKAEQLPIKHNAEKEAEQCEGLEFTYSNNSEYKAAVDDLRQKSTKIMVSIVHISMENLKFASISLETELKRANDKVLAVEELFRIGCKGLGALFQK
ncbi:hypothetical protein BJ508DRAFT_313364 [Ascobolus immersus RN42]|uniref:Uncharacterized protein n=1 Tax=Ascobolus immersus RN42 TaxID=1160509 RepID=A0A3N4HLY6_ASCIM|nr:hypothetical protein BJ508DRAFT_313364 [Ascobolus immersus RN42]